MTTLNRLRRASVVIGAGILLVACARDAVIMVPAATDDGGDVAALESLPAFPRSIAASDWQETGLRPPGMDRETTTYDDLDRMLQDLAAYVERAYSDPPRITVGLVGSPTADAAKALVHEAVREDGPIAGYETLVELARSPNGWYIVSARSRQHCRSTEEPTCR